MEIRGIADKTVLGQIKPAGAAKSAVANDAPASVSPDGDQVQISSVGQYLEQYSRLPATRADKVAQARQAIEAGTMDTDAKLSVAVDRLLDDLLGG